MRDESFAKDAEHVLEKPGISAPGAAPPEYLRELAAAAVDWPYTPP